MPNQFKFKLIKTNVHKTKDICSKKDIKPKDYSFLNLVYVGRLVKGKGLRFLIDTLSSFRSVNYTLSIIGDGDLKKAIEENDTLPRWCTDLIATSEDRLVMVTDYLLSKMEK